MRRRGGTGGRGRGRGWKRRERWKQGGEGGGGRTPQGGVREGMRGRMPDRGRLGGGVGNRGRATRQVKGRW